MGARPLTTFRRSSSTEELKARPQRGVRRCHKCNDNYKVSDCLVYIVMFFVALECILNFFVP